MRGTWAAAAECAEGFCKVKLEKVIYIVLRMSEPRAKWVVGLARMQIPFALEWVAPAVCLYVCVTVLQVMNFTLSDLEQQFMHI